MQAKIPYKLEKVHTAALELEDIGNFAIRCTGNAVSKGSIIVADYYMLIKTYMGLTSILTIGPIVPDIDKYLVNFSVDFKQLDFKESKIESLIDKFINDARNGITEIVEVQEDEIYAQLPTKDAILASL